MKRKIAILAPLLLAAAAFAQTLPATSAPASSSIFGVWQGQLDGLPAVTMTVTNEGGSLSGAVVFALHKRKPGGQTSSTAGAPEPLLHPTFDGHTLRFEVSHRHAHPPKSLADAPLPFRMEVTSAGHAVLHNDDDPRLTTELVKTLD